MSRIALTIILALALAAPTVAFALDVLPRKARYKPPLDRLKY